MKNNEFYLPSFVLKEFLFQENEIVLIKTGK